jgi:hypothetical protein
MAEPVTTLLGFFLSAATAFGKLAGWLRSEKREDRQRLATYFDQIAACMREVAERIEAGDPPRDTCRRLAVYADELYQILDDRRYPVGSDDASVEAARLRLIQEIRATEGWWVRSTAEKDRASISKKVAAKMQAVIFSKDGSESSEMTVDHFISELEREFTDQADSHEYVQKIWNAAGEFSALADSLRVV